MIFALAGPGSTWLGDHLDRPPQLPRVPSRTADPLQPLALGDRDRADGYLRELERA